MFAAHESDTNSSGVLMIFVFES